MERLQLSLTSDNPEDKNISQILARLHYTGTDTPDQTQGELLQDEALGLISGNLDASLFIFFITYRKLYSPHITSG